MQGRCFAEAYDTAHCSYETIPLEALGSWERVLCHTAFRYLLRRNGLTDAVIKVLWLGIRQEIAAQFRTDASARGLRIGLAATSGARCRHLL